MTQGQHDCSSAVMGGHYHPGDIRIWGQETQGGSRAVAGGNHALCLGVFCATFQGPHQAAQPRGSLQGKIGPSVAM